MNTSCRGIAIVLAATALVGCGPSVGVGMGGVGMMPMGGVGMMPMGGFAYGGGWGHSTNVAVINNRTTDVYASNRTNNAFVREDQNNFYHPGRFR